MNSSTAMLYSMGSYCIRVHSQSQSVFQSVKLSSGPSSNAKSTSLKIVRNFGFQHYFEFIAFVTLQLLLSATTELVASPACKLPLEFKSGHHNPKMSAVSTSGGCGDADCGLIRISPPANHWGKPQKYPIPLQSVEMEASVVHAVAQVQITQVFVNKEEVPIEAVYYFPVDPNGAVTHFEAELEGRKIKAVVKPDEEAKKEYEKAVERKQTAFLGEENKADIFKISVGYLKPGSTAKIIIGYVTEVENERDCNAIRFYIPTTVAPRYVPIETTDEKAKDLRNMQFSETTPAPMTIKTHVSIQGDIKSIECPTHKISVSSQGPVEGKTGWTKATVELNGRITDMDRDFVLLVTPAAEPHKPRVYIEKLDKSLAVMAHLIPSFKLKEQKTELIFVLDRSGSMSGASINLAKEALKLFLHSLPMDCYFNIVGFGSNYELLFPKSVKYDDDSLKTAKQHANGLDANMGGTEILAPLKHIYSMEEVPGYLRQIFVITDGEVGNEDEVIGLTKAKSHHSRVFALGIGSSASHHLVEGIAKAGGGNSAFVTYNESVTEKVLQQLKDALQPSLTDVHIKWHGVKADLAAQQSAPPPPIVTEKTLLGYGKPVETTQDKDSVSVPLPKSYWQAPEQVPPIFDGSQLLIFSVFEDPEGNRPTGCTITAESPDGPLSLDIELSEENDVGATGMVHKLAAIKIVRELELKVAALECGNREYGRWMPGDAAETEVYKEKITQLAVREGIASKYTSFVAVDTTGSSEDDEASESWVMQTRMVPTQIPHGWHGYSSARSVALAKILADQFSRPCGSYSVVSVLASSPNMLSSNQPLGFGCRYESSYPNFPLHDEYEDDDGDEFDFETEPTFHSQGERDVLEVIVSFQSFNGSFKWEESLLKSLELDILKAEEVAKKNGWNRDAWTTALTLTYFETKLSSRKGSWELVAKKAKDWLSKNHESVEQAMLEAAASLIKLA